MIESIVTILLSTGLFIIGFLGWFTHKTWFNRFIALIFITNAALIIFIGSGLKSRQSGEAMLFLLICISALFVFLLISILIQNHSDNHSKNESTESL